MRETCRDTKDVKVLRFKVYPTWFTENDRDKRRSDFTVLVDRQTWNFMLPSLFSSLKKYLLNFMCMSFAWMYMHQVSRAEEGIRSL